MAARAHDDRIAFQLVAERDDGISRLADRDVNLVGEKTGNIYASATSLIDPASLPAAIAEGLAAGKLGIGGVIRELGLETYRQVVGVGQSAPDTLWRSYRLFYQGDVLMQICETFDLARFKGLGAL